MPNPKTLLFDIVSSIATTEGFYAAGDEHPKRDNNPGDLISTPTWHGKVDGRFRVYPTLADGLAAAYSLVIAHVVAGNSLRQLISIWAPASDGNNTNQYIKETAERCGIDNIDEPLKNYLGIEKKS